jgi:hypothetical protein
MPMDATHTRFDGDGLGPKPRAEPGMTYGAAAAAIAPFSSALRLM